VLSSVFGAGRSVRERFLGVAAGFGGTGVPAGDTPNRESHVANDSAVRDVSSFDASLGPSFIASADADSSCVERRR
jgi:hypothetical protein